MYFPVSINALAKMYLFLQSKTKINKGCRSSGTGKISFYSSFYKNYNHVKTISNHYRGYFLFGSNQ